MIKESIYNAVQLIQTNICFFCVVNDSNIKKLRLTNRDYDSVDVTPNMNGLFAVEIDYPFVLLEKVYRYDHNEEMIYEQLFTLRQ